MTLGFEVERQMKYIKLAFAPPAKMPKIVARDHNNTRFGNKHLEKWLCLLP
jgi:hypothetical protein